MAVKLKKLILEKLGSTLLEKGFKYDKTQSKPSVSAFVFSKGEPEPQDDWFIQADNGGPLPQREEISICKMRWGPLIKVDLRSLAKRDFKGLFELAELTEQKWWSIETEEEARESFEQILDWLNQYAWNWFVLK
jgi:hypothetical protein